MLHTLSLSIRNRLLPTKAWGDIRPQETRRWQGSPPFERSLLQLAQKPMVGRELSCLVGSGIARPRRASWFHRCPATASRRSSPIEALLPPVRQTIALFRRHCSGGLMTPGWAIRSESLDVLADIDADGGDSGIVT